MWNPLTPGLHTLFSRQESGDPEAFFPNDEVRKLHAMTAAEHREIVPQILDDCRREGSIPADVIDRFEIWLVQECACSYRGVT